MINLSSEYSQDIIKSIAIFYIILYSHFNVNLLTCYQKKFINSHKYIIGFLCLYFLVTLFSTTGQMKYVPPIQKLIHSVFYYFLFLLSVRLDNRIMILVIFLIIFVYFNQLNIDYYNIKIYNTREPYLIKNKTEENYHNNMYAKYHYWFTIDYPVNIKLFPVKNEQLKVLSHINKILYYIIVSLLIFGFICYGGEIKDTMKNNKSLTWFKVITDTKMCKSTEPKSLLHYFKSGIGIKV